MYACLSSDFYFSFSEENEFANKDGGSRLTRLQHQMEMLYFSSVQTAASMNKLAGNVNNHDGQSYMGGL